MRHSLCRASALVKPFISTDFSSCAAPNWTCIAHRRRGAASTRRPGARPSTPNAAALLFSSSHMHHVTCSRAGRGVHSCSSEFYTHEKPGHLKIKLRVLYDCLGHVSLNGYTVTSTRPWSFHLNERSKSHAQLIAMHAAIRTSNLILNIANSMVLSI